jgi:hypothetical protein
LPSFPDVKSKPLYDEYRKEAGRVFVGEIYDGVLIRRNHMEGMKSMSGMSDESEKPRQTSKQELGPEMKMKLVAWEMQTS